MFRINFKPFVISALCFLFIGVASPAKAGVLDFFGIPDDLERIRQQVVERLLADFQDRAHALIIEGENTANALLVQAGNEVMMAIGGAEIVAQRNSRELLRDLDDQQEEVFAKIESALDRIEEAQADFVALSDIAALDIEQLMAQVPFADDAPFYIRRVDGLIVHPTPGPLGHTIRITGSRFGLETSEASTSISLEIDGRDQGFESYSTGEPHIAQLVLPQSWIDEQKSDGNLRILPITIRANQVSGASGFRGLIGRTDTVSASLTLRMVIIPDVVGRIRPVFSETARVWIENEPKNRTISVLPAQSVSLQEAPGVVGGVAELGDVRFIDDSAKAICRTDIRDAYQFPRLTLPRTDQMFSDGWSSLKEGDTCLQAPTGFPNQQGNNIFQNPYIWRRNQQAERLHRELGISESTVRRWLGSYRTNPDRLCHIPASQLIVWANAVSHDFSACPDVRLISSEPDAERTTVTFRFGGSGSREATYDISAQFERYDYNPENSLVVTNGDWQDVVYGVNEISLRDDGTVATKLEFQPSWSPDPLLFIDTQVDAQEGFSSSADTSQGATRLMLFSYEFPG